MMAPPAAPAASPVDTAGETALFPMVGAPGLMRAAEAPGVSAAETQVLPAAVSAPREPVIVPQPAPEVETESAPEVELATSIEVIEEAAAVASLAAPSPAPAANPVREMP